MANPKIKIPSSGSKDWAIYQMGIAEGRKQKTLEVNQLLIDEYMGDQYERGSEESKALLKIVKVYAEKLRELDAATDKVLPA